MKETLAVFAAILIVSVVLLGYTLQSDDYNVYWKISDHVKLHYEKVEPSSTTAYIIPTSTTNDQFTKYTTEPLQLNRDDETDPTVCEPLKNIYFMKTHKTAGTVVQNILLRYGLEHGLHFAMPKNAHDFGYPGKFSINQVQPQCNGNYNIMCFHMIFDRQKVSSIMPADTKYVSIVREPLSHFQSSFDYFYHIVPSFQKVPQSRENVESWLDHAEEYVRSARKGSYSPLEKNSILYDFGYDNRNDDEGYISRSVAEINRTFDLIMISDYMDESLVLLGELMCWDVEELACLKLNARTNSAPVSQEKLDRMRAKTRKWNKGDAALFDLVNATFWGRVERLGKDRMASQLDKLRKAAVKLKNLCLESHENVALSQIKNKANRDGIWKPKGVEMTGFNLTPKAESIKQCQRLIAPELKLCKAVFDLQNRPRNIDSYVRNSIYVDPREDGFYDC